MIGDSVILVWSVNKPKIIFQIVAYIRSRGLNINTECGSLVKEFLKDQVKGKSLTLVHKGGANNKIIWEIIAFVEWKGFALRNVFQSSGGETAFIFTPSNNISERQRAAGAAA